jgi:hypothetical protein
MNCVDASPPRYTGHEQARCQTGPRLGPRPPARRAGSLPTELKAQCHPAGARRLVFLGGCRPVRPPESDSLLAIVLQLLHSPLRGQKTLWGFPPWVGIPQASLSCTVGCWCRLNAAAPRITSSASRPRNHTRPHETTPDHTTHAHSGWATRTAWRGASAVSSVVTSPFANCRPKMMGGKCRLPDRSRSGKPRADLNRDRTPCTGKRVWMPPRNIAEMQQR